MDPVNEFVAGLLKEAKLDTLPDDLRHSIEDQLVVQTYKRVGQVIMTELNTDQAAEFAELISDPEKMSEDTINRFLTAHTTNMDQKLKEALSDLGAEFLANLKKQG